MALRVIDILKENLSPNDPVTINSWMWGDMNYTQSGLRDFNHYGSLGAYHRSMSSHKTGQGFDLKFKNKTTDEVLAWIKENWKEVAGFKLQIEDIESTRGRYQDWFHVQTRDNMSDELVYVFKP